MSTPVEVIKQEAQRLGFQAVGIARVESRPRDSENQQAKSLVHSLLGRLQEWLRRGYQGDMQWMARDPARRSNPESVLPGCRSIISVGMNYHTGHQANEQSGYGRIARYAWGKDYHHVLREKLKQLERHIQGLAPEAKTLVYVDTGPIMEKAWAQQAGLGWIGKHSNMVSPQFGSWLLLGEILTTLDLDPDEPGTDLCGSCSLCIRACPTGAITEPYVVDAQKCISYLTIEHRGGAEDIPQELRLHIGNRIFGCDDCLDVCPYNVDEHPADEPAFQPSPTTLAPHLMTLSVLSDTEFAMMFKHSAVRRAKHTGFLRNIRLALDCKGRELPSTSVQQP